MLLRSARSGDDGAMNQLFERYLPRVRRIVAARLGRSLREMVDLDDIVQETLLDAFHGLQSPEQASLGHFYNWIAKTVENNIRDQWRRAHAIKRGSGRLKKLRDLGTTTWANSALASPQGTPSEIVHGQELDERLERALLRLRDEHREVVVLRLLCEMSYADIAAEMELENAELARAWMSRALRQMRDGLDPSDFDRKVGES